MEDFPLFIYAVSVTVIAVILSTILIILLCKKHRSKAGKSFSGLDPLSGLSHEIRTPLNVIIGFSDMLVSNPGDPRSSFYLESIGTAGRSLLDIVNDVLDFSKVESGKINVTYSPCSLDRILKETEQIFTQRLQEKDLSFEINNRVDRLLLLDETRIRQIIINLIANAIKHTDSGGIKLGARLENTEGKPRLIIAVEDTGKGIPKEDFKRIFNPFEQSQGKKDTQEGFGLGLAISRRLANLMGGDIFVESVQGRGSVFTVSFPHIRPASSSLNQNSAENSEDNSLPEFSKDLVLVVDDNFSNAALLTEYLKKFNLSTVTGANGEDAVRLAKEKKPALILMDLKMPVMDGYEAAKILRKDKIAGNIPIVAITAAHRSPGRKKRKEDLFFDDYLLKPLELKKLMGIIETYISSKERSLGPIPVKSTENPELTIPKEVSFEFMEKCRKQYIPRIADLKEVIVYSDLISFSKELMKEGQKEGSKALMEYSEELQLLVKSFNMGRIRHRLDDLALVLEQGERLVK